MDILKKIAERLNGEIKLTNTQTDGRLNSAIDESIVIDKIADICEENPEYEFFYAPDRFWYDCAIKYNSVFYPINIKISTCNTADNVSSKLGMYYALTGIEPDKQSGLNQWEGYMNSLYANICYDNIDADYFFLIVNKEDASVHVTSLMNIKKLTPNGNNLPFQARGKDNFTSGGRDRAAAIDYILDVFYASWEKKCSAFATLQNLRAGAKNSLKN